MTEETKKQVRKLFRYGIMGQDHRRNFINKLGPSNFIEKIGDAVGRTPF